MPATEELRIHLRTVADTTGARQTQQALRGVEQQATQTGRAASRTQQATGVGWSSAARNVLQYAGALGLATTGAQLFTRAVEVLGDSIQAQRDYERIIRATGAAYGQQAQQFERFATSLSAATGFASQAILEAAISARTLSANYGLTIQQTQKLITVSADLARVRGIGIAESFERIQSAIRGEAEASEYLGLTLNDTFIKNNAMNGSLRNTFERMSDAEKAQVRYTELLRQTAPFAGQASAALDTLEGSLGKAAVSGNALQLEIGKLIEPATISGLQKLASAAEGVEKALERGGIAGELLRGRMNIQALPGQVVAARRDVATEAREKAIADELELQRAILATNDAIRRRQGQEVPTVSGAYVTERAAAARHEERTLAGSRERLAVVEQLKAAQGELLNLEQGARQLEQARAQLALQEAQASTAALAERRGIAHELEVIGRREAQRARESAQIDREQAQRVRELTNLERQINDVLDQRLRLQQESAQVAAEIASLPSQFALEDAQERLQRARLVAADRGRSAGERAAARREIRAEDRALPGRELAAFDATAAIRDIARQQRVTGLVGRAAQIPLEERRIDLQEQVRVTQDVVDAIHDQMRMQDELDQQRRADLQGQQQSSQAIVDAIHDQGVQLNLAAQTNALAIESQQDRIGAIIAEAVQRAQQTPSSVNLRLEIATPDSDPYVVYQELIEANRQAVMPSVVKLSGVRR